MTRILTIGAIIGAAMLSACANTGMPSTDATGTAPVPVNPTATFELYACSAISTADGFFVALSPTLVATGKLTQDDVTKATEADAVLKSGCANPSQDPVAFTTKVLAQVSALYLLLGQQAPAAPIPAAS